MRIVRLRIFSFLCFLIRYIHSRNDVLCLEFTCGNDKVTDIRKLLFQ